MKLLRRIRAGFQQQNKPIPGAQRIQVQRRAIQRMEMPRHAQPLPRSGQSLTRDAGSRGHLPHGCAAPVAQPCRARKRRHNHRCCGQRHAIQAGFDRAHPLAQPRRRQHGPGLFLRAGILRREILPRQGAHQRRQPIREQATFLEQACHRQRISLRRAEIKAPPAPAKVRKRSVESLFRPCAVTATRKHRAQLRERKRRWHIARAFHQPPRRTQTNPPRHSQRMQPIGLGRALFRCGFTRVAHRIIQEA